MENTGNSPFKNFIGSYVSWIYRNYALTLIVFVAVSVLAIHFVSKLKLKSDFAELLPEHYESVIHLNKIMKRIGGLGSLYIAIESDDLDSSIRFAQDYVKAIDEKFPKNTFKYVDYNINALKNFYEENKYLYIDLEDLKEIHKRLKGKIEWEKLKSNPFYISLEDEGEKEKEFKLDDIINKYKGKTAMMDKTTKGYYVGENGKLLAILTRPYASSTSVDYSKKLVDDLGALAEKMKPKSYHPSLKVGFGGTFITTLDEYAALKDDILSTILLCVSLISLAIFLYYFRVRFVFMVGMTVFVGTLLTFMITYFKIGYLNSQTAFLGSVIIGNGINYGLIFFARYLEERRKKFSVLESLIITSQNTVHATFTAAVSTSAAFAILVIAQNRGFSQFGFIGAIGMILCWFSTYTFMPALLTLSEKILPVIKKDRIKLHKPIFFEPFSRFVGAAPKAIVVFGMAMVIVCVAFFSLYVPRALETDFSKLRNKESFSSGTAVLNRRIGNIFSLMMHPATVLADREDQVKMLCDAIDKKQKELLKGTRYTKMIDKCVSVYSFLPENQDEKLEELAHIKKLLGGKTLNFLNKEQKDELSKFRNQFDLSPLTKTDLPLKIQKLFEEKNGTIGLITYIYPSKKFGSLWDGRNLSKFADLVRKIDLPNGEVIHSSGSSVIFADLLEAITRDGPLTSIIALIAVIIIVFFNFKTLKASILIISNLLIGMILMGGLLAIFNIKLNYFNFIAIPVTIGIGVDYAVNVYQRYKYDGKGSILNVIKTTGGAVALCSLTTIIGYSVLIIANNQALASFGWVAIIGEFSCFFVALLFLPAVIILLERREKCKIDKENQTDTCIDPPIEPTSLKELDSH